MLSKIVEVGSKVELQLLNRSLDPSSNDTNKIFFSQVNEILSEDQMEILMPMEKTKLIILAVGSEYDMVVYGEHGLYQAYIRVIDRYKINNIYTLVVELTSNLRKFQRREYYRFSCAMEMSSRYLVKEELAPIEQNKPYQLQTDLPLQKSVVVDISGGGLRFISVQKYQVNDIIYCECFLHIKGEKKLYQIIGKILNARVNENRPETYEYRVKYLNIDPESREEIIKFIFEEERKNRKKERFL